MDSCQGITLYINNVDENVDLERLREEFAEIGNIICVKKSDVVDQNQGLAVLRFTSIDEAKKAITDLNERKLGTTPYLITVISYKEASEDDQVYSRHLSTNETDTQKGDECFCDSKTHKLFGGRNLYVKNLDDSMDITLLRSYFDKFGTITSANIMILESTGERYGFVSYFSVHDATRAIQNMNGHIIGSKTLEVVRAYSYLDPKLNTEGGLSVYKEPCNVANQNKEKNSCYCKQLNLKIIRGVYLYVKNIDKSLSDADFCKIFQQFGIVTYAKVMRKEGHSKGYGFVCYKLSKDARNATIRMNGRVLGSKQLYVALAKHNNECNSNLERKYQTCMFTSQREYDEEPTVPSQKLRPILGQGAIRKTINMIPKVNEVPATIRNSADDDFQRTFLYGDLYEHIYRMYPEQVDKIAHWLLNTFDVFELTYMLHDNNDFKQKVKQAFSIVETEENENHMP